MQNSAEVLIGMAALGLSATAALVVYRWRQKKRIRRVEKWVKEYLSARYGALHCEAYEWRRLYEHPGVD